MMPSSLEPIAIIDMGVCFPEIPNRQIFTNHCLEGHYSIQELSPALAKFYSAQKSDRTFKTKCNNFGSEDLPRIQGNKTNFSRKYNSYFLAIAEVYERQKNLFQKFRDSTGVFSGQMLGPHTEPILAFLKDPCSIQLEHHAIQDLLREKIPESLLKKFFRNLKPLHDFQNIFARQMEENQRLLKDEFGFKGPFLFCDSACASGMNTNYYAMEALRQGDIDVALSVGMCHLTSFFLLGFNLAKCLGTEFSVPFDARADGLIPAIGASSLVLMRLSDAEALKLPIEGLILNIGFSSNKGPSLWGIEAEAEALAIQRAYQGLSCDLQDIDYIEAQANSNQLGDEAEYLALKSTYGKNRKNILTVTSGKSLYGHASAPSGLMSTMRAAIAMKHKKFLPTINVEQPRFPLPGDESWFRLNTSLQDWPESEKIRRVGVSSFGYCGVNFHSVVEEYIPTQPPLKLRGGVKRSPLALVGMGFDLPHIHSFEELSRAFENPKKENLGQQSYTSIELEHPLQDYKKSPKELMSYHKACLKLLSAFMKFKKENPKFFEDPSSLAIIGGTCMQEHLYAVGVTDLLWELDRDDLLNIEEKEILRSELLKIHSPIDATNPLAGEHLPAIGRLSSYVGSSGLSHGLSDFEDSGSAGLWAAKLLLQESPLKTVILAYYTIFTPLLVSKIKNPTDNVTFLALQRLEDAEKSNTPILATLEWIKNANGQNYETTTFLGNTFNSEDSFKIIRGVLEFQQNKSNSIDLSLKHGTLRLQKKEAT